MAQLPKKFQVIPVVCLQIFAGLWKQTLPVGTNPLCHLLFAGRVTKICCRAAHIVNIPLKVRLLSITFGFPQNGPVTSGLDNPSLMKSQSAEITAAKAAPVAGDTELNLFNSRNFPLLFIHGMICSHIRQLIDLIHFLLCQWFCRGILYHKPFRSIGFCHHLSGKGVCILILNPKTPGIGFFFCR